MITTLGPRIVVIGNSGSGKSTLAKSLEARLGGDLIDLDSVHWLDKVGLKRDEMQAKQIVAGLAAQPRWIIEGVFGWLAEVALPSATSLIWLDMPWSICRENLAMRGPWRGATADEHADFLAWAEDYWRRTTSSSFTGHLALFENFHGTRQRFTCRSGIADFIDEHSIDDV
jgi:adenylate kinase family enzyme